ncbi:HD domain-containing protein [Exiguobacterium flavidum]|uniref:HD domain-containing protein n=1 Tax=Exiguobacterium flavidum TaxID=2184695 RepID=UPI0013007F4C|nr:HD domain-containing protein [Exiguobacterium flavidum]
MHLFKAITPTVPNSYTGSDFPVSDGVGGGGFTLDSHSPGETVEETLLVAASEIRTSQTGKQWLQFTFNTGGGSFKGKQWLNKESAEKAILPYRETGVVQVVAKVEEFPAGSGNKSLTVQKVTPGDPSDASSLLPQMPAGESLLEYRDLLLTLIETLDEPYRTICLSTLKKYWDDFSLRPAALFHHHAYIGGLLKHTACMLEIGRGISSAEQPYLTLLKCVQEGEADHKNDLYHSIESDRQSFAWDDSFDALYTAAKSIAILNANPNWNELAVGILFHDIGKLFEYNHLGATPERFSKLLQVESSSEDLGGIGLDEQGILVGHMPYGCFVFEDALRESGIRLPIAAHHRILHMILSHHGKREWGSSVLPQTSEAWYLHAIDLLDARKEKWRAERLKQGEAL